MSRPEAMQSTFHFGCFHSSFFVGSVNWGGYSATLEPFQSSFRAVLSEIEDELSIPLVQFQLDFHFFFCEFGVGTEPVGGFSEEITVIFRVVSEQFQCQ